MDQRILKALLRRRIQDEHVFALLQHIIDSFSALPGKGIPLGNLTSQLFANIYLHELDWFVKHELHERWYARYCDDFVIVHPSRQYLIALVARIEEFLNANLNLYLHPDKVAIRSWGQGIDFVGYVLLPHCTILRTKTKQRLLARVNAKNLASYLGLCSHATSHRLRQVIMTKTVW